MPVKLVQDEEFAVLTLDRPAALNALSFDMIREIGQSFDQVGEMAAKREIRALLITGAGEKSFCAGADIGELRERTLTEQLQGARLGQTVFAKLDELEVPSVALVNGYAFGGGSELALACTFRLASENAAFGLPEIKLGLIPGYGGTQRLPRLIGESRGLEMIMTGRTVRAAEAEDIGLVNKVIMNDLIAEGKTFARRFTRFGLPALNMARRAVQRGGDLSLADGLALEADLSTLAYQTKDAEEGMAAFSEKRDAVFQDV